MPMRKRVNKDGAGTQPTTGEREDEVSDDSEVEFLSLSHATTSRPKRKREAKSKVAPKELTEEEMFDLAVRLSEQEASDAALRRQREEDEALQRAIEESMSQTQPLPPSRSPSPLLDIVPGRRRLEFCSDDPGPSARLEVTSKRSHPELDHKGPGDTNNNNRTKRKRNDEDSSPLPEMPDLSQTQKIFTQTSPFPSSSQLSEPPTTQDFDCTQHPSSSQLPPPEALRPSLVCTKMSQELLATCQSGSVSCSQENLMSRPKTPTFTKGLSLTADPTLSQSPTFPRSPVFSGRQREQDSRSSTTSPIFGRTSQNLRPPPTPMLPESPALSKNVVPAKTSPSPSFLGSQGISKNPCLSESLLFDKSDIFSAADLDDDVDTQPLSQDYSNTSPVFGKVSQKNKKPSLVCKPNQSLSNTSPTFPKSTENLTESSRPLPKTLLLSESDPEDDVLVEQDHAATSPVFGRPSLNQRPSLACKPNLSGSPTFPRDPAVSKKYPNIPNTPTFSRSPRTPILSETNSEEEEVKVQSINTTSPVFGRASQGLRPSLACKPNISLSRSPTVPRSQTDSESLISSKSPTFPKSPTIPNSPLFSDSERDSEWTSWKSRISLSPVFPAERSLLRPNIHSFSPNYKSLGPRHRLRRDVESSSPGPSSPRASNRLHWLPGRSDSQGAVAPQPQNEPKPSPSQGLARRLPAHTLEAGGGVMVCYCWGVPFCPPGCDPDNYTEVIVDQLEFYEKSLKRAQRGLLRKAVWGEPIVPQPEKDPSPESSAESPIRRPTRRRGLRLRPKRRAKSTSASSPEREENEEEEKNDVEQEDDIKDEQEDVGDEVEDSVKEEGEDNRDEEEDTVNKKQDQKEEDQEQRATAADEGDSVDCEVCPETQLDPDDDETQVLIIPTSPKAEPQSQSPSQSPSESQTVLPVQPQSTDQHRQTPEEMDVDAPADEEKEQEDMIVASPDGGQDETMEEEAEVFNTSFLKRRGESWTGGSPTKEKRAREDEEEETMATALRGSSSRVPSDPPGPRCSPQSQASSTMACPLCQASFPLDQIEMHAATCYGVEEEEGGGGGGHFALTAADHLQASSPRPKRARNRGLTAEETAAHSSSSVRNRGLISAEETAAHSSSFGRLFDKKEKCYICHKTVPLSEFGRHTEKCIRQQTSRSEQRGDLLSALEQTESRDATEAGPSGVTYKEVIDLSGHEEEGEGEEEEEESEVLCVSDSPIRAFTSVSEASDCLVDFKKQLHPRSPTRRAAGRRGGGRRGGGRGGGGASRGRGVKRKYKR